MPRPSARDRLLDATAALLIEAGPAGVTLDAVAARAGASKGGLLYHFASKSALYSALCAREVAAFDAQMAAAGSATAADLAGAYVASYNSQSADTDRLFMTLLMVSLEEKEALAPFHAWIRAWLAATLARPGGEAAVTRMLACDALWLIRQLGGPLPGGMQERLMAYWQTDGAAFQGQ